MADATIVYEPGKVSFEPREGYPYLKLGYERDRRVRVLLEPETGQNQYQVFGAIAQSSSDWKALPDAAETGKYLVSVTLSKDARLVTEEAAPWALTDKTSLTIAARDGDGKYAEETVTIAAAGFADIGAATATELAAVINAACSNITAEVVADNYVMLKSVSKDEPYIAIVNDDDDVGETIGLGYGNNTTIYGAWREQLGRPAPRGLGAQWRKVYVRFRHDEGAPGSLLSDWIVWDTTFPLLPMDVRLRYLFGIPLTRADGTVYTDEDLYELCLAAVSRIEAFCHVYMTPTRFMAHPDRRTGTYRKRFDYDLEDSPYDYDARDAREWWYMTLRHYPIIGTPTLRLVFLTDQEVFVFPEQWVKVYHRTGQLHITPGGTGLTNFAIGLGGQYMPITGMLYRNLPQYCWVDYTAGWQKGEIPAVVLDAACKMAAISIMHIAGDAVEFGTSSRSLSDGVISQSWSSTAGVENALLGARINQYKKELEAFEKQFAGRWRRPKVIII